MCKISFAGTLKLYFLSHLSMSTINSDYRGRHSGQRETIDKNYYANAKVKNMSRKQM